MNAVFDVKSTSSYDDELAHRYHFPNRYLRLVEQCAGDWIILRQPRADHGSKAYIATARVQTVQADLIKPGHSYAFLTDFLRFDADVSWQDGASYREQALRDLPRRSGVGLHLRGKSVRHISYPDYQEIVWSGFQGPISKSALQEFGDTSQFQYPERRIASVLLNRAIREAAFRSHVCNAYGGRCAISGLMIRDGSGHFEAEAAHILPVAAGGPDIIRNGIALAGTIHWMFDRHLISISDDFDTIFNPRLPQQLTRLLPRRPILPNDHSLQPDLRFIAKHREIFVRALLP